MALNNNQLIIKSKFVYLGSKLQKIMIKIQSIRVLKKSVIFSSLFRIGYYPHNAISPLDGRYNKSVESLNPYFSEAALMKYRVKIEAEWLLHLLKTDIIKQKSGKSIEKLEGELVKLWKNFDDTAALRIKTIQKSTNHDLKSVEYFIKENITVYPTFIHFCCTSEDINNLAYSLMLSDAMKEVIIPNLKLIHSDLVNKADQWADDAMLARTHGQPASPTTLGKQYANFAYRIGRQIQHISNVRLTGKFSGAVGNYNAHYFVYPEVDWRKTCHEFVEKKLGLEYNPYTTQIESHDNIARLFSEVALCNTILLGLCKDTWEYTSKNYLKQKIKTGEVGSSTMPHKVNPIDFENCEGNLGIANSYFNFFSSKLPVSRLQRDLSDSTVLRNQGVALGYSLIAYKSLLKGLSKIISNKNVMYEQLTHHTQVVTEGIQTELRKIEYPQAYQLLKKLSRDKVFDEHSLDKLVEELRGKINDESLQKISQIRPQSYLGKASELAKQVKTRNDKNQPR